MAFVVDSYCSQLRGRMFEGVGLDCRLAGKKKSRRLFLCPLQLLHRTDAVSLRSPRECSQLACLRPCAVTFPFHPSPSGLVVEGEEVVAAELQPEVVDGAPP